MYEAVGVMPSSFSLVRNTAQSWVSVSSIMSKGRPTHSKYNLWGLAGDGQRMEDGLFGGFVCPYEAAGMTPSVSNARGIAQTKIRNPNMEIRIRHKASAGSVLSPRLIRLSLQTG